MKPYMDIDESVVKSLLESQINPSKAFSELSKGKIEQFKSINNRKPNGDELKYIYSTSFAEINVLN